MHPLLLDTDKLNRPKWQAEVYINLNYNTIHVGISVGDLCYVQPTGILVYFCNGYG